MGAAIIRIVAGAVAVAILMATFPFRTFCEYVALFIALLIISVAYDVTGGKR